MKSIVTSIALALCLFLASPAQAGTDKDKVFVATVQNVVPSLAHHDPGVLTDLAKVTCIQRRLGVMQFEVALGMYKFLGVPYYVDTRTFTNLAVQFYCPKFQFVFPS
jgi:hypothetical protein